MRYVRAFNDESVAHSGPYANKRIANIVKKRAEKKNKNFKYILTDSII